MGHLSMWLRGLALSACLLPGMATAQATCGNGQEPCTIDGGIYHAETPNADGPHPAVFFLHGYGGRGAGIMRNRGLTEALLGRGYAVIAPQGMPRFAGDKGGSWNSRARASSRDDVAWLIAIADDVADRFDIDRERIVLAGFSGGGMMAWRVACDAPESFAAYAPVAGLLWRPLPVIAAAR